MSGDFALVDMGLNDESVTAWGGEKSRVTPGVYDFEIENADIQPSRNGNPTLVVFAVIVTEGPMYERKMRNSYTLDRNNNRSRARLRALTDATNLPLDDKGRFAKESLVGCRFHAEVIEDSYNDADATGKVVVKQTTKWIKESAVDEPAPAQARPAAAAVRRPSRAPMAPSNGTVRPQ